jgi:hypothetical protein
MKTFQLHIFQVPSYGDPNAPVFVSAQKSSSPRQILHFQFWTKLAANPVGIIAEVTNFKQNQQHACYFIALLDDNFMKQQFTQTESHQQQQKHQNDDKNTNILGLHLVWKLIIFVVQYFIGNKIKIKTVKCNNCGHKQSGPWSNRSAFNMNHTT